MYSGETIDNKNNNIRTVKKPRTKKGNKLKQNIFNLGVGLDIPLMVIVITLVAIRLIMLFSASYATALYNYGDSYYYIKDQALFAFVGIIAMLFISTVDYHIFKKLNGLMFLVTFILLFIVAFIPTLSSSSGDAVRWIRIGPISFQPSEVAKFTLVVMLATILSRQSDRLKVKNERKFVIPCFVATGVIAGLVIYGRHVSATLIIMAVAFIVMTVGGVKLRWFMVIGVPALLAVFYLVFFTDAFAYALVRIQGWLDVFNPPDGVDTYQTLQSIYAIGAGQLFGVGLGQSTQKYLYLPEARNDFIFAVVCEELGFVGAIFIIGLFVALIWRGVVISINAMDKFGTLLGIGMTFTVGIQAILNICVVTNAIPNTGISLPFFSDGGTSLLMLLGEMGVLLSVSRRSYAQKR